MAPGELTAHLLLALGVIVVAAHLGGSLAQRLGQPRVLGEIVAGILLGPSALGAAWPAALDVLLPAEVVPSLKPLADLGLVLFMFLVGAELDLGLLRGQSRRAIVISNVSIVAPFALGALIGWWVHADLGPAAPTDVVPFALFVGAAMAVTAFPVLARILQETGLGATRVGALTLACAAVDDVTAWCVLAAVLAIADGDGAGSVAVTIGATAAFALAMWFGLRPLLARRRDLPLPALLALAVLAAWATEVIGIHAIFGAFLAGAILPRRGGHAAGPIAALEPLVATLLLPVFFMIVGVSTEIGSIDSLFRLAIAAVVLLAAILGKLGGAMLAARAVGESWRDAWTIGTLMNTRGLTEIVILTVGLEEGIIGPEMFTILVVMALATTLMAVPVLRAAKVIPVAPPPPSPAPAG